MKIFKFFQNEGKQTFQFEITNNILKRGNISWTREYSETIRRWISDLYFENRYENPIEYFKYFSNIDRTCEIMITPSVVSRQHYSPYLSIRVKIWATNENWMIAELSYPIEHIIYR